MCLIVVAWKVHPDYPLAVAANRDEWYARPTAAAAPWAERPDILGGRDLEAGGTWLGITRGGRFAAVTNVREGRNAASGVHSRGQLTAAFLAGTASPCAYLAGVAAAPAEDYAGFNLLVGDGDTLAYYSNRGDGAPRELPPGIYGVSNHLLDTPWPKLTSAKAAFTRALEHLPDPSPCFALLGDDEIVADAHLPDTGVGLEWERRLSAIFVRGNGVAYGTRASTVVLHRHDGAIALHEQGYGPAGPEGAPVSLAVAAPSA
ncbi:hypothetical protein OTERR_16020 [Oryzomicrobium terrae]|uniref:NRDE family protein n=1 Tax=Oryzomicrobium terrae TaxID=1735038 RepID=A0A5C1E9X8_9RHOO|nr:NRDE family protein [Oryzomicrobium terrae]QEL65078.1 hypothetical protein OTERR_16020 [Oryzomicrobium terrae]